MAYQAREEAPAQQPFGTYLEAVRRRWLVVVGITLLAVAAAVGTFERASIIYTASASILVTPLPAGTTGFVGIGTVIDTGDPTRTVQTAAALIDTPDAAALAAKRMGPPWTAGSVLAAVSVTPRGASNVLAVTANAPTPIGAQRLANAFARSAIGYRASVVQGQINASIDQLELRLSQIRTPAGSPEATAIAGAVEQLRSVAGQGREPTLSVSQTASSPGVAGGSSLMLILLLAVAGGLVVGSVSALALETFNRRIRDRAEAEELYPVPVLAAVRSLNRRRSRNPVPPWAMEPSVFEQLRMLRVQVSLAPKSFVIMVASAGAGDGKTTIAAGLAAAYAEVGKRVVLMDLDFRKPGLLRLLGVDSDESRESVPAGAPIPVPSLPRVQAIPAMIGDIKRFDRMIDRLPQLIEEARRSADVIILDTAPLGEASEALRLAPICDQIVFVVRPRHTERRKLIIARDLLQRAGRPPIGLVLVGRDAGAPDGHQSYAYTMQQPTPPPPASERPRGPAREPGAPPVPTTVAIREGDSVA